MNYYKIQVFFIICFLFVGHVYSQVTYEFCMTGKYGKTIVLDFKVHNNTTKAIPDYTFVFNWPGISNAVMWSGMDVIQNGDKGIVELKKNTWGSDLPVGTTTFSINMTYEPGMFPPDVGTLNGSTIKGITCYTPPAYENFKCMKKLTDGCMLKSVSSGGHEIKIGEGSVFAWGVPMQVYIPENRKGWAIGMAVSHSLFTNLMGFDAMSINEYFATAIQESNAGCEGSKLIAPSWVTTKYPSLDTKAPIFCYDLSGGVAVGYFQQEMGGSWTELDANYPCFIPFVKKDQFTSTPSAGSSFEFQSIVKAYHDYRNVAYWQYVKCWNPIDFFKNSKDPYAAVKIIALAYNQGMNSGAFEPVFVKNRTAAVAATNLMDYISPASPSGLDRLYAEQINRITKVLDNKASEINWNDAAVFGVTDKGDHSFRDFYDAQYNWSDVEDYIKKITPFYKAFGVDENNFLAEIKPVFDKINGGKSISFRYQMGEVIDAIVLYLPVFDPKKGLGEIYGAVGGNGCFAPTARMEGENGTCLDVAKLKVYFSGEAPYSFSYKRTDVSPEVVYPEITTSVNPYIIKPVPDGVYSLVAVRDNTSAGEVVCTPVEIKSNSAMATASLVKYGDTLCSGAGSGIQVQITSSASGPFTIEYEIDGILQSPVTLNNTGLHTLVTAPAKQGIYRLTKISTAGCASTLDDTMVIDKGTPASASAKLIKYGGVSCSGLGSGIQVNVTSTKSGPFIIEYEMNGIAQSPVTISSTGVHTFVTAPAKEGTYRLTKISVGACNFSLDETLVIYGGVPPKASARLIKYGGNSCLGENPGVQVEITSPDPGPFKIEYEINGVLQSPLTINNAGLYTLIAAPSKAGSYRIVKISTGGCDFSLDHTLVITDEVPFTASAKLAQYGDNLCSGTGSGVQLQITSSNSGPFTIAYELDGIAQSPVTVNNAGLHTLIAAPAKTGTYRLTKITVGDCDFSLDDTLVISAGVPPKASARLIKYGGNSCLGENSGAQVEITSSASGPFTIEYEFNGIVQSPVTINNAGLHTLIAAPAKAGTYRIIKMSTGGCNFSLDDTLVINKEEPFTATAKLFKYGENFCLGENSGVQVEITSIDPGPFTINYTVNGIAQSPVTITSAGLHTLVETPAKTGTYRLTKISTRSCNLLMDDFLVIDENTVSDEVTIEGKLRICKGESATLRVNIRSHQEIVSYQWKVNGNDIFGADTNTYVATQEGNYTVSVSTSKECHLLSAVAKVIFLSNEDCALEKPGLDYPKFFTPNGDGYNDTWHVINLENVNYVEIDIFDRYGKFITHLTENSPGWDGTYKNNPVLASDYWFVLTYEEMNNPGIKKQIRSHFSLKR